MRLSFVSLAAGRIQAYAGRPTPSTHHDCCGTRLHLSAWNPRPLVLLRGRHLTFQQFAVEPSHIATSRHWTFARASFRHR